MALLLHPMLSAWNTEVQWWLGGSGTCSTSKDFIEYVCFVALRANPPHPNVLLWPLLLKRPNWRPCRGIVIGFCHFARRQLLSLLWSEGPHSVFICKMALEVNRVYILLTHSHVQHYCLGDEVWSYDTLFDTLKYISSISPPWPVTPPSFSPEFLFASSCP